MDDVDGRAAGAWLDARFDGNSSGLLLLLQSMLLPLLLLLLRQHAPWRQCWGRASEPVSWRGTSPRRPWHRGYRRHRRWGWGCAGCG
jgi:hypothetical protein